MGCASVPLTTADIDYFQPPIVATVAPERPITNYSLYNNTIKVNLAPMRPIIPAYNNKGNLLASWTPHPQGIANQPTVVIVHGGHGLIPGDFATAVWARDQLGANTLVLDSYWSRGQNENWVTYSRLGANARTLDAIAAGKDTATPPGRCPTRVFSDATAWTHYPEATHGWDASNRGAHTPSVDGECGKALNVLNHFAVCRSDAATNDMHAKLTSSPPSVDDCRLRGKDGDSYGAQANAA